MAHPILWAGRGVPPQQLVRIHWIAGLVANARLGRNRAVTELPLLQPAYVPCLQIVDRALDLQGTFLLQVAHFFRADA